MLGFILRALLALSGASDPHDASHVVCSEIVALASNESILADILACSDGPGYAPIGARGEQVLTP